MEGLTRKFTEFLEMLKNNPSMVDKIIGSCDEERPMYLKNQAFSECGRKEGNRLFCQDDHDAAMHHKILQCYNQAVAFAENDSEELASAYGNRSALLRHIRKYAESITEIDKALKITNCAQMKVKLLCRKADCYTALGSPENRGCLEKARFIFAKSTESEKVKKKMEDLIAQTQSKIDAGQLDQPKENRKRTESLRITAEAEKMDVWSSVKVEYNEKYGRHLVAARNFEPGEVILVEKSYANHLDCSRLLRYCSHCFAYLWTVYPCDHCSWRLFCSEECRIEALNEYHDIECSAIVLMEDALMYKRDILMSVVVKTFIKAVKEAGGIDKLQQELKSIDECQDEIKRGFSSKGVMKDFHAIYIRQFRRLEDTKFENYLKISFLTLMGLAKFSSIFKANYDANEIGKVLNDKSAVFAGALVLKLCLIINCKNTTTVLIDPFEKTPTLDALKRNMVSQDEDNMSLKSIGFLSLFGCMPNAHSFFTYGNRFVMHAITPIEKGSPMITPALCVYYLVPTATRQALHKKIYNRPCDCQACRENWSEKLTDNLIPYVDAFEKWVYTGLIDEIDKLEQELKERAYKLNFPDPKSFAKATKHVAKAWDKFEMPSTWTSKAVRNLIALLMHIHTPGYRDHERLGPCKK